MIASLQFTISYVNLIQFEHFNWKPMSCILLILLSGIHLYILNNTDLFYKHELYPNTSICIEFEWYSICIYL